VLIERSLKNGVLALVLHTAVHLGIGASIVETLLLDENEPESIYKAMCDHWTALGTIKEEIIEGVWKPRGQL
jgi:hypothetical protein